jgi:DNA-binding transcriptional regulator YhcF (GntR family)
VIIRVDLDSVVPPYEQIREQIETMAISGVLASGAPLPSIRQLAADLGVAPGTVAHAYGELASAGIVRSRTGRGTVVAARGQRVASKRAESELRSAADVFTRRVQQLGVAPAAALAVITDSLNALPGNLSA